MDVADVAGEVGVGLLGVVEFAHGWVLYKV